MFRVLLAPIIRSISKLYMQISVQSCIDVVSYPVSCGMAGRWKRLARVVAESATTRARRFHLPAIPQLTGYDTTSIHDCTEICMYSFEILLMMGAKSARNI
jgi:hypothetical protein